MMLLYFLFAVCICIAVWYGTTRYHRDNSVGFPRSRRRR